MEIKHVNIEVRRTYQTKKSHIKRDRKISKKNYMRNYFEKIRG